MFPVTPALHSLPLRQKRGHLNPTSRAYWQLGHSRNDGNDLVSLEFGVWVVLLGDQLPAWLATAALLILVRSVTVTFASLHAGRRVHDAAARAFPSHSTSSDAVARACLSHSTSDGAVARACLSHSPVSYTHLTLPTTPYV